MHKQIIKNIREKAIELEPDKKEAINNLLDNLEQGMDNVIADAYEDCPVCGSQKNKQLPMCENTACWYDQEEVGA